MLYYYFKKSVNVFERMENFGTIYEYVVETSYKITTRKYDKHAGNKR